MPHDQKDHRVHIIRYKDRDQWRAEALAGNEVAKLCQWATSQWMRSLRNKDLAACACCEVAFQEGDVPQAFIVLIPVESDPEMVRAKAAGICRECSKHDDTWLGRRERASHRTIASRPAA